MPRACSPWRGRSPPRCPPSVHAGGPAQGQLRVRGRSRPGAEQGRLPAAGRVHAHLQLWQRHQELGHRQPDGRRARGREGRAGAAGRRHPGQWPHPGLHARVSCCSAARHRSGPAPCSTSRHGARSPGARSTSSASRSRTCSWSATASTMPSATGSCLSSARWRAQQPAARGGGCRSGGAPAAHGLQGTTLVAVQHGCRLGLARHRRRRHQTGCLDRC